MSEPKPYIHFQDIETQSIAEASFLDEDFVPGTKGMYFFNRLKSNKPGQGGGTKVLKQLLEYLEQSCIPILNQVSAYGNLSQSQLTQFYKKHGFVPFSPEFGDKLLVYYPKSYVKACSSGKCHVKKAQSKDQIISKVIRLLQESKSLPDTDYVDNDLWRERNHKNVLLAFFNRIMELSNDQELLDRLTNDGLEGSPLEVYSRLNSPKHPVRNRMIVIPIERIKSKAERIDSPDFKEWFGPWDHPKANTSRGPASSQATDERNPQVFYHGTRGDFSTFEVGREGWNSDAFFGSWPENRHALFFTQNPEHAGAFTTKSGDPIGGNIMPVYLNIRYPLNLTSGVDEYVCDEFETQGINRRWMVNFKWDHFDGEDGKRFVEAAKNLGYDSVIFHDENPDTRRDAITYAVFDPSQVKSAIGNSGKFDPKNPDIRADSKSGWYTKAMDAENPSSH